MALDVLNPDDPYRPFVQGLITFEESFDLFRESTRAMARMNLADAGRRIEEASQAEQTSGASQGLAEAFTSFREMFDGFRQLIDAQQSYVKTLRDAVLGNVTAQHVTDLTKADDLLRTGLGRIETSAPALKRFMRGGGDVDVSGLRESIDLQREAIRNLRQLVGEGLKPKELVTRSSPRFLIYFALTFIVVLFGSRLERADPGTGWEGAAEHPADRAGRERHVGVRISRGLSLADQPARRHRPGRRRGQGRDAGPGGRLRAGPGGVAGTGEAGEVSPDRVGHYVRMPRAARHEPWTPAPFRPTHGTSWPGDSRDRSRYAHSLLP